MLAQLILPWHAAIHGKGNVHISTPQESYLTVSSFLIITISHTIPFALYRISNSHNRHYMEYYPYNIMCPTFL